MTAEDLSHRYGREFPRGAVVFREGDPAGPMFVVQRGEVRITTGPPGGERLLATLGPGEFFGEMAVLTGEPRTATATCAEPSKLLVVDGRSFEGMLRANGEIAVRMIRKLAERLRRADEEMARLAPTRPRGGA
jgi:CRP-like cAMP-binding protein